MSENIDNLPPPPSYEEAVQGQAPRVDGTKTTSYPTEGPFSTPPAYPTQTPYPLQQNPQSYPGQYPQQPYPGYSIPGQYPPGGGVAAPGQYPPSGYPVNPGYNYNTYSGNVAQSTAPVNRVNAGFYLSPDDLRARKRKQMVLFFCVGVVMVVVFIIIVSSQMS